MLTATWGTKSTVIEATAVGSAWLVAVTVTVCCTARLEGAVYRPDELIAPAPDGLIVQVTVGLSVFATEAVSCAHWLLSKTALAGLTLISTDGPLPLREIICG